MSMIERQLGRLPATDDNHIRKYPLTASTMPSVPTPVVLGINWYDAFDRPVLKGTKHYLPTTNIGRVRGGHAVCLKPPLTKDNTTWWEYYDQGNEGACVGFSSSRMMTLLNRERYDGFKLYHAAQKIDEWPGEDYSGTSVRAGMDILRKFGPFERDGDQWLTDGIVENRWALSIEDIARCLSPEDGGRTVLNAGYVVLLNSWGTWYPHYVRVTLDLLKRLVFTEDGEATVVTDRR